MTPWPVRHINNHNPSTHKVGQQRGVRHFQSLQSKVHSTDFPVKAVDGCIQLNRRWVYQWQALLVCGWVATRLTLIVQVRRGRHSNTRLLMEANCISYFGMTQW